jgi:predicted DNA-binding protein (MmcQ/YjbR family)
MPFDENVLVFRLHGKICACVAMDNPDLATMKCDPEKALELREQYSSVEGAFHWNKKFWNQIHFNGDCGDKLILELVNHSYQEVVKKLPKKEREALKDIL